MGAAVSTTKKALSVTESTAQRTDESAPMWIYTAQVTGDTSQDLFGATSPGMQMLGPNTIVRERKGQFDTDGARWKKGFTEGKHIFEIVYPVAQRGLYCSVGVGTDEAPVYMKGKMSLIGSNGYSWGIDLRSRRSYHRKTATGKYPSTMVYLPDKFYMYIDVDSGTLMFASDLGFYGTAFTNIRPGKAIYPMVCACQQGATITMVYRGQGDPSRIPNLGMTPAGPPMAQPEPRKEPPPMDPAPKEAPPPYMEYGGREGTSMSKMTDTGPPPPPPTKMSNQQQGAEAASPLPEKEPPIPEDLESAGKKEETPKES